jgi:hypothetical protein
VAGLDNFKYLFIGDIRIGCLGCPMIGGFFSTTILLASYQWVITFIDILLTIHAQRPISTMLCFSSFFAIFQSGPSCPIVAQALGRVIP